MIIPQKHFAVNWTTTMRVNAEHFIGHGNYIIDQLRDTASLHITKYNFGLLPPLQGGGAVLSNYDVSKTATGELQIRVSSCHAITPGGTRIAITDEGLTEYISLSKFIHEKQDANTISSGTETFYVVLVVNPFNRIPDGSPNPNEVPIRQPFTQPQYSIQLVNAGHINEQHIGAYHLVIGRIIKQGDNFKKDEDFIAPCSAVISDEKLSAHYKTICKAMEELQTYSLQIVQKINFKNQKSTVAKNSKEACAVILNYMSHHYFPFRNVCHQQPPIYIVDAMAAFAGVLNTFIQLLPESEKEELLNYFHEWSDITQVVFMSNLADVIEINYNHYHVGNYMKTIMQMLNIVVTIWRKLSALEFIGQHKENIIVKEEVITQVVKEKKGWSILD